MLNFIIQARSGKIDIFGMFTGNPTQPTLRTKPVEFVLGKRTTDPELALITLPNKEARDLANKILRAVGLKEGS
ncbi:hypothetical protein LCGC14_1386830 [marine sediment metagenome]|uniref:Uncharacterized protein n=1 Tax=marine sediment metagenome TaxID=412755 RepID=A0A0F9KLZ8_9ZZZZ